MGGAGQVLSTGAEVCVCAVLCLEISLRASQIMGRGVDKATFLIGKGYG